MAWLKWLPWRFTVRYLARSHGFIDPIALLAILHRFAQPAEVAEPIELLRAGVVMHARGLINSRVIQHNLDWVWPYWVEKQFNPRDRSFIPRAFTITHINLTHRNWTAIGVPDYPGIPIVDPRGLLTPFLDGWSLDSWLITEDRRMLLPSRMKNAAQYLDFAPHVAVRTELEKDDLQLILRSYAEVVDGHPVCRLKIVAKAGVASWLVLTLRPYNPEGISFINKASLSSDRKALTVDDDYSISFSDPVDHHHISTYRAGDVLLKVHDRQEESKGRCKVGMLTAAALFKIQAGQSRELMVSVPLDQGSNSQKFVRNISWQDCLARACQVRLPDMQFQFLYEAAVRTLAILSPGEVFPGPFTYKRFWFRDAAYIINALLCCGLIGRAERAIRLFPERQTLRGYFLSQEGEWDSNGAALWIMERFCRISGKKPDPGWLEAVRRGGRWIVRKRLPESPDLPHAGLLPAGFSAEHLGPNDYFYWDDFWGIAGLRSAAFLMNLAGDSQDGAWFERQAEMFRQVVQDSLAKVNERLGRQVVPASPYRRLDAGAIGAMALSYPLQICGPEDAALINTVDYLLANCMVDGGFFQDMIHSGINPYLTLHIAQVLLRAGRPEYFTLMHTVAKLASPTGQWPEAIHPRTRGGCMGDGQHAWAAAEWLLMIRNCFVREEENSLILASGIPTQWLKTGVSLAFGPAPTAFGTISLTVEYAGDDYQGEVTVSWDGEWHYAAPVIEVRLAGFMARPKLPGQNFIKLEVIMI